MRTRHFGMELEFDRECVSRSDIERALRLGVAAAGDTHPVSHRESFKFWSVKNDKSCGFEVSTPAMRMRVKDFDRVSVVFGTMLEELGTCACSKRCGLHVHVEVSDVPDSYIVNAVRTFWVFEGHIFTLFPSREHNPFVFELRDTFHKPDEINCIDINRYECGLSEHYSALSLHHYLENGTVELRYAAGTLDTDTLLMWPKTVLCLFGISMQGVKPNVRTMINPKSLALFIANHYTGSSFLEKGKGEVIDWIMDRAGHLKPKPYRKRRLVKRAVHKELKI